MAASSLFQGFAEGPTDSFGEGKPVSSIQALQLQSNLLHLTDEFAQTRINWVAADTEGVYQNSASNLIWSQTYVHRWLGPGKPANVDIHLWGEDCIVRARLVPHHTPRWARDSVSDRRVSPAVFDELIDLSAGGIQSGSYTHQNDADSVKVFETAWYKPGVVASAVADGVWEPQVCLMRLELEPIAESGFQIIGVCLREFA